MAFPYKHVVVIGATSGIGKSMAEKLVQAGSKVTVVGRRKERLVEFVQENGESKATAVPFDIGDLDKIPRFADVMKQSPDVDCIFLNAGIGGSSNFSKPETVDLERFNYEMKINFTAHVALVHAFTPFLLANDAPAGFIFTGSGLGVFPAATLAGYSTSKAALNVFAMCLRDQLRNTKIKVIDILPPPVQTEFHPDPTFGMPLDKFTEETFNAIVAGQDEVRIGTVVTIPDDVYNEVLDKRRAAFEGLAKLLNGAHNTITQAGH